jgi:hypothetical protein
MSKILNRFTNVIMFEDKNLNIIDLCVKFKKNLFRANLSHVNLSGANLSGANLSDTNLSHANLSGANLSDINLLDANLSDTNLSGANLSDTNLSHANLSGVNLSGADLSGADLFSTTGNKKQIKSMQIEKYSICYTVDKLQIGCENHLIDEWRKFTDEDIREMDGNDGLHWRHKWKEIIFKIIEMSPAVK